MKRTKSIGATPQQIAGRVIEHYAKELGRSYGLQSSDIDDLRQEGQLAALEALAGSARPQGAISTFLSPYVRGAMLLWLAKQDRHGMTGAGVVTEFVELEHDTDEKEGLTIDETSYVEESISAEQLVRAIDITPAYDRALLIEYYGLKGRKPLTRRQLAAKRRVSDAVMRGLLASALRELNKSLRSMGIDSEAV